MKLRYVVVLLGLGLIVGAVPGKGYAQTPAEPAILEPGAVEPEEMDLEGLEPAAPEPENTDSEAAEPGLSAIGAYNLGVERYNSGDYTAALEAFDLAIEKNPSLSNA